MWPFTKKAPKLGDSELFRGLTDWHSHILPGVDDGIQKMEDSLAVLKHYEELGVKAVWLTPHIMEEVPNTPEKLRARFEELQAAYDGPVQLNLAAENMLDSLFEERVAQNNLMPYGPDGSHILIETSYVNPPMGMEEMIYSVMSMGLTPVLAHPERYRYMDREDYAHWKERGLLFQTNIMSLLGMYGETARDKAQWLLREGLIDLTGNDLHRHNQLVKALEIRPKDHTALDILVGVAHNPNLERQ